MRLFLSIKGDQSFISADLLNTLFQNLEPEMISDLKKFEEAINSFTHGMQSILESMVMGEKEWEERERRDREEREMLQE